MVKIEFDVHSDEDAMALRDVPDGWLVVCAAGWWFAGRACELTGDELTPLGPFPTAAEAADAAVMEDRREGRDG